MKLKLSEREKEIIRIWFDAVIDKSGHWGDGAAIFPDEENVFKKLDNSAEAVVDLTARNLDVILMWAGEAIGDIETEDITASAEEIMLIRKLKGLIENQSLQGSN